MSKQKRSQDHFAVVEFDADESEPSKRLIEVIRYAWLTEDGTQCFCPSSKNWIFELKNYGIPRGDWAKHACRVLKYNMDSIKAANIECSLRLNYTTSDTEEYGDQHETEKMKSNSNVMSNKYNNIFDQARDNESLVISNNNLETLETQPNRDDAEIEAPSRCIDIDNSIENQITTEQPIGNVICIQYESFQKALQDLAELKQGQLNSDLVGLKVDQIQSNLEKITAQNEIMMKMISEFCKKSPASSSFIPAINIDSKTKLDELETQLQEKDFKENMELRQVVFGTAAAPPRGEWSRTGLTFPQPHQELPFGLRCPRNATRGLQSVLQAYIIKHFTFDNRPRESVPIEQLLKPQEAEQMEALWNAMATILWNIGEKQKVVIVLPGEIPHIAHTHKYFQDSVTEKLYLFELTKLDDLQIFLKRFLKFFTEDPGPGALLFLYSAVLTRSVTKVRTDLDAPKGAHLMGANEEGSMNIVTLLLAGRATPYLHNGVVYVGDEDHYALPQFGVLARSTVGLLVFEGENEAAHSASKQPGSRLKTPALPIWVTSCCGHFGILFNSNRELLRNYHAEKRFELHYYTCAGCYISMTVDNRALTETNSRKMGNSGNGGGGGGSSGGQGRDGAESSVISTPLERLIHTKWQEAKCTLHGPAPPSMNF